MRLSRRGFLEVFGLGVASAALPPTALPVPLSALWLPVGEPGQVLGMVDGVLCWVGDKVLITGQADPQKNGVWQVTSVGDWDRPWSLKRV